MQGQRTGGDHRLNHDVLQHAIVSELVHLHPAGMSSEVLDREFDRGGDMLPVAIADLTSAGLVRRETDGGEEIVSLTKAAARFAELVGGSI